MKKCSKGVTVLQDKQKHAQEVLRRLAEAYPTAHCELNFRTPWQLLVATILAAQSTDLQVNKLTGPLFAKYPTPQALSQLSLQELEEQIKGCGLYHNKAKNILATCHLLLEQSGGEVPAALEELVKLPGVGRKTANVVLANAFDVPAFAVDTHVLRLSRRLGLSDQNTPDKVEADITALIPPELWKDAHHWLIWHGRRTCHARKPECDRCPVQDVCREHQPA
jgi:endonuclease-3